ncbi:MAG: glycosyltransferase family 4 protein [Spirochaetota bacterium]
MSESVEHRTATGERDGPLRIALVIPGLTGGGSERVLSAMANHLADRGHAVRLVTLGSRAKDAYVLSPAVDRVALGVDRIRWFEFRRYAAHIVALRRAVRSRQPQVTLAFQWRASILCLLSLIGARSSLIISERSLPDREDVRPATRLLRKMLYPGAALLVVMTEGAREAFSSIMPADRIRVIPNFVDFSDRRGGRDAATEAVVGLVRGLRAKGRRVAVAMGRLHPVKGFDMLIRAFARAKADHPEWELVILGEGGEEERLRELAASLDQQEAVHMPGRVAAPHLVLEQCDLFVQASRFEGFGIALIEAMAVGLPSISTDCPTGPREIIRSGRDGVLVANGSEDELTLAMQRLMSDPGERERLGANAQEVRSRFDRRSIMSRWEQLLREPVRTGAIEA